MKRKRFVIIAVAFLSFMLAFSASLVKPVITEAATTASGKCGTEVTWTLSSSGKLTIKGTGAMENYEEEEDVPWYDYVLSIESVVIKSGVTSIGDNAFFGCEALESISIPKSVTSIGVAAFGYCETLTSITLPSKLASIGACAFSDCYLLTTIEIPSSVTSIGMLAFQYCYSLETILFKGKAPEVHKYTFGMDDEDMRSFRLCYHSSKSGWTSAQKNWKFYNDVTWYDLDSMMSADEFTVTSSLSVKTGSSKTISTNADEYINEQLTWTSSNNKVAYVNSDGTVTGVSGGKATITVKSADGTYSGKCKVTVSANTSTLKPLKKTLSGAAVSYNLSANNYTTYGSTVSSYLIANDDGTLTRVENTSGTTVVVETYSSSGTLQNTKTIKGSLSYFGGFYSGEKYNFLVYGQSNSSQSSSKEVIRVVKYSKSWKKLGTLKLKNINTVSPFDAGSLRMTELNGYLYIHTCHEMYKSSDGKNHQANMTFVIKESSMTVTYSHYTVSSGGYGYVSHSFNQFIQTDGEYIFRVDHGDGYPRGVYLSRVEVEAGALTIMRGYRTVFSFQGTIGENATGASIGGFELSSDYFLIAGNSVDQSSASTYSASGTRNIFLSVTSKSLSTSNTIWITDYDSSDGVTVRTPQLVKVSDDVFLLMWEEYYSSSKVTRVKAVLVGGDGTLLSSKVKLDARLSDCQPVYNSSTKCVTWYVSDGEDVVLYRVNPYRLSDTAKSVTSADITLSSTSYTYNGSKKTPSVTVKIHGKTLKKGTDYTVSYSSGRTKIGKYTVTIKGKGSYTGTITKTFKIVPKQVSVSSAKSTSKTKITVKWKKASGSVSKYQIRYRKKGSTKWTTKTVSSSTLKKTLTGLKSGKTYQIQVRAYKTVSGTKYYGKWSSTQTVKVK